MTANISYILHKNSNAAEFDIKIGDNYVCKPYIGTNWAAASGSKVVTAAQSSNTISAIIRGDWSQQDNNNKCRISDTIIDIVRIG